jgi:hypothetical protein
MSMTKNNLVCPKCGKDQEVTIWDIINVQKNPEMKEKVKDKSAFLWHCTDCDCSANMDYPCFYLDPEKNFMILYLSEGSNDNFQQYPFEGLSRMVRTHTALVEKIKVLEEGLNDRAIELMKHAMRQEANFKGEKVEEVIFDGIDENRRYHFVLLCEEDKVKNLNIDGDTMYEQFLGKVAHIEEKRKFHLIDQAWGDEAWTALIGCCGSR